MNRKSFFKKLLALGVGAVCVTTGAMFAACNKDNKKSDGEENNPPAPNHVHQWSTGTSADAWGKDATNHWRLCLAEGHGTQGGASAEGYGAHSYTGNVCDTCGYEKTSQVDPGQQDPPSTKAAVTIDMKDVYDATKGTVAAGTVLGTNSGIKAYGVSATVEANEKPLTYKGEKIDAQYRYKLDQTIVTSENKAKGLEVKVEEAATVIVYAYSGSSGSERKLALYDDTKTIIAATEQSIGDGNNDMMGVAMFSVDANKTYYIGATSAGVNLYYIAVVYGDIGETWEHNDEVPASCGVAGNIEYSVSNYGRYKDGSGNPVLGNKTATAALTHSYTLKTGSIVTPTDDPDTNPGKVTLTCANGHETDVNLPVLSSDEYTQTADGNGQSTYAITVNGVSVTFTAATTAVKATTYTDVYALNAFTGVTVGSAATTGSNCVYATGGTATVEANGSLKCNDGSANTTAYVQLGTGIASGVVKITGSMKIASNNGSWTFFQILNTQGKEVVGFRTVSGGAWCYRLAGGNNVEDKTILYAASTDHTFEILLDLDNNKVSITVDTTVLANAVEYTGTGEKALGVGSVFLNVNSGRTVYLNSVTFATKD